MNKKKVQVNMNYVSLLNKLKEKIEQSISKILDNDDIAIVDKNIQQIKDNLNKFEESLLSYYSNLNTLEMNSLFDFIIENCPKLMSNNISLHRSFATIKQYFIKLLTMIIIILKKNIRIYACRITDMFIENLLFSVKYNDEEHNDLFLTVIEGLRQFILLIKSGCGIEVYLPDILQCIEETITPNVKREESEINEKYVIEKTCECLKLEKILLDYPATRNSICKYVIKTYVPVVTNLLEGYEQFPFDKIECQNQLRNLIVHTSLKLENTEFSLRGLTNSFLQYFMNKNYDNETVANQRDFLRRIDIPIAPPLCISVSEKNSVNNILMENEE